MKLPDPKRLVYGVFPIFNWSKSYDVGTGVGDLIAGITVALTLVPQSIAYASLAGLEPQYGLYASFAGGFVYAIMGTCPQINIGPTALLSLLTFTYTNGTNPDFTVLLCLTSGIVQLIAGILQLGFLVEFVSLPVVSGFTSAAAITIASSQIKGLLGLKFSAETFIGTWKELFQHIGDTRLPDTLLSLACCIVLLGMKALKDIRIKDPEDEKNRKGVIVMQKSLWFAGVSRNAVVVVLAAVIAFFVYLDVGDPLILTGKITPGLPTPQAPPFHTSIGNETISIGGMLQHLGSGLLVVPLVGIISNVAIAKAFTSGKTLDATQEIIALGACNVVGAFFRSFPVNGSFTRSAVSDASGVRTPAAGFYTGIIVLLTLALLTPYFFFIPRAALSAVIVCAVLNMVDVAIIKRLWNSSRLDIIPLLGTFVCCLALGIEIGLICGVGFDVLLLLYYHSRPPLDVKYVVDDDLPPHYSVHPVGGLHFAGAEKVRSKLSALRKIKPDTLETLTIIPGMNDNHLSNRNGQCNGVNGSRRATPETGSSVLVIHCDSLFRLDYTFLQSLKMLLAEWSRTGRVVWCDARPLVQDQLSTVIPDPVFCESHQLPLVLAGEISLLLASDVFFKIIEDGKIEGGPTDPILLNTKLGYIVSSTGQTGSTSTIAMHTVVEPDLDHCVRQFWEAEKVPDIYQESLSEHEYSEKEFQESVTLQNNTFEVKFPLKIELQDVDPSNSYAIALQRLYSLEKRFRRDPVYHDLYIKFIHEYLELGHAKIINTENRDSQNDPLFFLPHHAVLRPERLTNKLRVVFDGSVKTKNGLSLNDIMCKGPPVQKSLFDILLQFRTHKYTLQCDVRHMYRMIQAHPDYRRLQNILWRENGVMNILQLQTITYGLTSSSFLATRCLIELARRNEKEYPLASAAIIQSSYVDDIQTGHNTIEGAMQLKNELNELMSLAKFKLHKWISNSPELLADVPESSLGFNTKEIDLDKSVVKILGLSYDAKTDEFQMNGRAVNHVDIPTKRSILSAISRLFDAMGFVGPVTMKAKLILQELWENNLGWDTPLPNELLKVWESFYTNLVNMPTIRIPRYIQIADSDEVQLLGYCDASARAYGCCIYIKVRVQGISHVHLLCSKSRLAGINSKLTIPKLELNGALLLAKLMRSVSETMNIGNVHLFCDSKVVLGWLETSTVKVPAYIGNRVHKINKLAEGMSWHFTPGLLNPGDILSRGCDPQDIVDNSLWKYGPDYLLNSDNYNLYLSEIEKPLECKYDYYECDACLTVTDNVSIHPFFEKHSTLFKTTMVMVYVLRFLHKCRKIDTEVGKVTLAEYRIAFITIVKGVQLHYFANEFKCIKEKRQIKGQLSRVCPFVDNSSILRVTGRLQHSDLDFSVKFPIILPKHCHITTLIIRQEHLAMLHGGLKLILSNLSQKYYIVNSVREVKNVIYKCVVCRRQKAEASKQLMGSLPKDRVTPDRAFKKVGLDFCGAFDIKQSSKRNSIITKGYVALFICFACKAIHLEVVSDMSTETFIAALKRFVARRGVPSDIYCDNASTFKGTDNQLKKLFALHNSEEFQNVVHSYSLQKEIRFHYIPQYSPNHGGLWERGVGSFKFHLKRISSCKVFTYEQFNSITIEIEGILNSRPLMRHPTQDHSDLSCLTPGHFLIGCPIMAIPQHDVTEIPTNRLRFWRTCEQVKQHFWKVWSKDYLSSLNERTKWTKDLPNLKEGAVVLLINLNTPPLHWPLGRVTKIYGGNDNKVRVVDVRTADGKIHRRAVSKLVVLPVE